MTSQSARAYPLFWYILIIIIIVIISIIIIIIITNSFSPGVSGDIFRNQDSNVWYEGGVELIEKNLKVKENRNTAKSAVLFVGDGMGITTITAARIYDGQLKGQNGEENVLSWETFPWTALAKTYHVDQQGADSASAATAFLCGIKTNDGMLSALIRSNTLVLIRSVNSYVNKIALLIKKTGHLLFSFMIVSLVYILTD